MIGSEPGYLINDNPYFLIDAPSVPGMSGSPIYKIGRGMTLHRAPEGNTALEQIMSMDLTKAEQDVTVLSFVGIYAGSTGAKEASKLNHLNLGRAHLVGLLNGLIDAPQDGFNPFPPEIVQAG
jgi:hypothetical protein